MNFQDAIARMPHKDVMCLIEEVLNADEASIRCRAKDHRHIDYPLRIGGQLMNVSLVELGAQAAAVHASLYGIGGHHAGLLLALHDVEVRRPDVGLTDAPLETTAERLHFDATGALYRFAVYDRKAEVVSGDAMLMIRALNP